MTLREKIAEVLYEQHNPGSWDTYDGLDSEQKQGYRDRADEIVDVIIQHWSIR